jgi:hypothetical protein
MPWLCQYVAMYKVFGCCFAPSMGVVKQEGLNSINATTRAISWSVREMANTWTSP